MTRIVSCAIVDVVLLVLLVVIDFVVAAVDADSFSRFVVVVVLVVIDFVVFVVDRNFCFQNDHHRRCRSRATASLCPSARRRGSRDPSVGSWLGGFEIPPNVPGGLRRPDPPLI